MSNNSIGLSSNLHTYLLQASLRELPVAEELRQETELRNDANMQIAPEQGQFMSLLWQMIGARSGIEIGVYTGYSALWSALALPPSGYLLACDNNPDTARVAQRYWARAELSDRIDLRIGPALATLDEQVQAGHAGTYDFAFIDADKENQITYYERCMALVRQGGVIAADNTLWKGRVADDLDQSTTTEAIRAFNKHVVTDQRVDMSLVPIADGLTLARKR